jgi:hypothetical protein
MESKSRLMAVASPVPTALQRMLATPTFQGAQLGSDQTAPMIVRPTGAAAAPIVRVTSAPSFRSAAAENKQQQQYFPYPDMAVHFAYPVGESSFIGEAGRNALVNSGQDFTQIKRMADSLLGRDIDRLATEGKFILLYPLFDGTSATMSPLIAIIGYLQYLRQSPITAAVSPSLLRIHLGSPHQYYRWLATSKTNPQTILSDNPNQLQYQIVDREPRYPSFVGASVRTLYPIGDTVGTVLVPMASGPSGPLGDMKRTAAATSEVLRNRLPRYNPIFDGVYCGDFQSDWESAYKFGKAGSYYKCLILVNAQGGSRREVTAPTALTAPSARLEEQTRQIKAQSVAVSQEIARALAEYHTAATQLARLKGIPDPSR